MPSKTNAKKGKPQRSKRDADPTEFDKEFVADTFGTPSPRAKTEWKRAKRKRGRPVEGNGAAVISVSIERSLLERCDKLAKKMHVSRSRLVARGLRAVLAAMVDPR